MSPLHGTKTRALKRSIYYQERHRRNLQRGSFEQLVGEGDLAESDAANARSGVKQGIALEWMRRSGGIGYQ